MYKYKPNFVNLIICTLNFLDIIKPNYIRNYKYSNNTYFPNSTDPRFSAIPHHHACEE